MTGQVDAPARPMVDPETLAIRAGPPRAIRFKRGMIVAIAALGSISLVAVAWTALTPRMFHHVAEEEELSQPNARATADALNGLPSSYGDVPKLGPPLPGDLGKPILEHDQSLGMESCNGDAERLRQAEAAEQERELAELKAARESGVLVKGASITGSGETPASSLPSPANEPSANGDKLALDPERDPNAQQRKADFVSNLDPHGDVNPHRLMLLPSPYTLSAGSVISASLITGLRSDLPGLVTAQVTEHIYDSATGKILLIPQGSRLIGSYDSVVAFGQSRALVVWQRIILPDGSSLRIDNVPATDPSGYVGLEDKVDFHTWALLKGVALSTLLGVSSELALSGQSDRVQAIRKSTQNNVSRAGDQITQLPIQTRRPAWLISYQQCLQPFWRVTVAFKKAGPDDMKIEARGKRPSAVHLVQEAITVRIPDAVRLTGMSRSRIYLLIAQGDIESVKVGRTRLIRIDSLKRYLLQETPDDHD